MIKYMKTRKEALEYCKNLLNGTMTNCPLRKEDMDFLLFYVFPLHPNFKEKCEGKQIKSVIVHQHPVYKRTKCFALVLTGNTHVDISYIECINRTGLKDNIESASFKALKDYANVTTDKEVKQIVKDWISSFDFGELLIGRELKDYGTSTVHFDNMNLILNLIDYYNGRTKERTV